MLLFLRTTVTLFDIVDPGWAHQNAMDPAVDRLDPATQDRKHRHPIAVLLRNRPQEQEKKQAAHFISMDPFALHYEASRHVKILRLGLANKPTKSVINRDGKWTGHVIVHPICLVFISSRLSRKMSCFREIQIRMRPTRAL